MSSETLAEPAVQTSQVEAKPQAVHAPMLGRSEQEQPVIAVRDVGKLYHVYDRPQDRLKQALLRWRRKKYYRDFWALKGVSFEVLRGEAVGILGRNGAGKSTLLQIIAGTMSPTIGEVAVRGRVAAMLELGAGFNPEFTGRENVYLGGAILGITRAEMDARFDNIAAFADIGEFLEQPIKTYSSGMAARLAFAVAFSVDPDLMIVDEILAVGDIGFQQKCVARLRQLRDNGLTMLFVSHSPDAVRSICQKGLFLNHGQTVYYGPAERATDLYLSHIRESTNQEALKTEAGLGGPVRVASQVKGQLRYGTGHVQIEKVEVLSAAGEPCRAFELGDAVTIEAVLHSQIEAKDLSVSFLVRDMTGVDVMGTTTFDEKVSAPAVRPDGRLVVRFTFENRLRAGNYGICLAVTRVSRKDYSDVVLFDQVDGCAGFVVVPNPERPVHYKFHQPVSVEWKGVGPAAGDA
ncbi:MAG TPA: ABC transporter ATP-binding protein [Phycisphaerales bacterium]|nr:ABC transporter ATP-binding protein [Phycisphaerales bacterium]